MATRRFLKSSMRTLGARSHVTSGVKASDPASAMMALRHKHDATSPFMPQAWIHQQMKMSSIHGAPIDLEQRPRLMDLRQGDKVMYILVLLFCRLGLELVLSGCGSAHGGRIKIATILQTFYIHFLRKKCPILI